MSLTLLLLQQTSICEHYLLCSGLKSTVSLRNFYAMLSTVLNCYSSKHYVALYCKGLECCSACFMLIQVQQSINHSSRINKKIRYLWRYLLKRFYFVKQWPPHGCTITTFRMLHIISIKKSNSILLKHISIQTHDLIWSCHVQFMFIIRRCFVTSVS